MKIRSIWIMLLLPVLSWGQMNIVHNISHDGINREYEVHLPTNYDAAMEWPVVINMHGLGSNRSEQRFYSGMNIVADTGDFIVVYPQGTIVNFGGAQQRHWNSGFGTGVDDLGFLNAMLDKVETDYSVNTEKVYSTGMSNGGYMSYYLACNHSDRITAIASVTGSMTGIVLNTCSPTTPIPIMQIHGTADAVVAFNGPPSIDDVVNFWVEHNNCDAAPVEEMIPDIDPNDNTTTIKKTFNGCDQEGEIWYYVVDNGGHTWPGAFPLPGTNTSGDFSGSAHVWQFFNQFPKTTTSNDEAKFANVSVYPNPVYDVLTIDGLELNLDVEVKIMDVNGRVLIQSVNKPSIQVNHLTPGVYWIEVGGYRSTFVKQ